MLKIPFQLLMSGLGRKVILRNTIIRIMKRTFFLFLIPISLVVAGQSGRKMTREEYIETYKELAMREMERTKIPASITLAQGILESGDGNSTLARKANNHFGIKCHDWKGKTIRQDDDEKNECFRKYKSVEHSYRDHSDFLVNRSRYADLFRLKPDDYKGWAKELKKAGYATSPTYAESLIRIIEENDLHQYDEQVLASMEGGRVSREKPLFETVEYAGGRKVHYCNRVKYVLAREGDNFYDLSEELDLFQWQLPKYNDMTSDQVFSEGDRIYLQPKRNRAEAGKKIHIVQEGQTLHEISQLYAIKEEKLASRNGLSMGDTLVAGQELLLRGKLKGVKQQVRLPQIEMKEEPSEEEFIIEFDADK